MVRFFKGLGLSLFFILSVIYLLPKINMYYALEEEILKYKVLNSKEALDDTGLSLEISNIEMSYDSIEVASIEDTKISIFGVYNIITSKNIQLTGLAASFVPINVYEVQIKYSIFNPLYLSATAHGDFGEAKAQVHLLENVLSIEVSPSQLMLEKNRVSLENFTKNDEGVYIYEKTL